MERIARIRPRRPPYLSLVDKYSVMVMDRKWLGASLWAFIASIFAVFGVIHQFAAGFKAWKTPTFEYCSADGCWDYSVQWMYFTAYLMLAGTFVLLHFVAKVDKTIEDPIIDETANAFDNWFSNAYTYVDEDGVERDSRDPDGTIWNAPPKKRSNLPFQNAARNVSVTKWQAH